MKVCSRCKNEKPLSEFSCRAAAKDGRCSYCKSCSRSASKGHYDANRDTYTKKARAWCKRQTQKLLPVYDAAKAHPCERCGNDFPTVAMDFHHIDGDKKYNVSSMIRAGYSLQTLEAEIAKCTLLCACCHRITHQELKMPL